MKNIIITTLALLCAGFSAHAQQTDPEQVQNGGMEQWDPASEYNEPEGWGSVNVYSDFGFEQTLTRTTESHTGNFAAHLQNKASMGQTIPGLLFSGRLLGDNMVASVGGLKFSYSSRPEALRFHYKAYPASDLCFAQMMLTRWNSSSGKADTIGFAQMVIRDSVLSYKRVDVLFDYLLADEPDSAYLLFSSSYYSSAPVQGGRLIIDDISVTFKSTGIPEAGKTKKLIIYPNPVRETLYTDHDEKSSLAIYDQAGRMILCPDPSQRAIDVSTLPPGIYLLQSVNNKNEVLRSRFVVD